MKHHQHRQYPYSDELRRRMHAERLERRAAAAHAFIFRVAAALLACWVLLALMAIMDGAPA
jgi:CHASE3 domain sensor protein